MKMRTINAAGGDRRGAPKHVLRVRDAHGEEIERVTFRGFEGRHLDAALDAFVMAYAAGDTDSPLWADLLLQIEGVG